MAAPSGITWGSIAGGYGRIGIYVGLTTTNTTVTANVQVWFWSKYSVSDTANSYYYNNLSSAGSATTKIGSRSINTTVASGSGWSTSNQVKLGESTYTYNRGTSNVTRYLYAKLADVDRVGATMTASATISIPKKTSYAVVYNAVGGSPQPSKQTKWYGTNLVLSTTKPAKTGYTFKGWSTSSSATTVQYAPGATYTLNEPVYLYAVWTPNTYTVTYNPNYGKNPPNNQTKTYGVTLTLSSIKPTRDNYTFKGWATSASATTAQYAAGGNYTANASVTLYAVWELSYVKPRITNVTVTRCEGAGLPRDDGTYATVSFRWECDKNATNIRIGWESSSTTLVYQDFTPNGTSGSIIKLLGSGDLSPDKTYTFTITVTDSGGYSEVSRTLNGNKFAIDVYAKGNGIAFGKPAEIQGFADFQLPIYIRSGARVANNMSVNGVNTDGKVIQTFVPCNTSNNCVIGHGQYDAKKGSTNVYGFDVQIGVSNSPTGSLFRPYRRIGDSFSVTVRTAGYVANGGTDIAFLVPLAVPVIGGAIAVATSYNGFVLRQNNSYTHGSAADVYVTPSSYSTVISPYVGVYIIAHFTNTTNVVNNSAIGIYWSGNLSFE